MDRIYKINRAVKKEIGDIIQNELQDPRLQFVTITTVEVSRDLQHAKVYFTVLGDEKKVKEAQTALGCARGIVRKKVGQRVRMRYTPDIAFFFDKSIAYSMHIDETIERIKSESQNFPESY